jgi:hypothetical protein
MDLDPKMHHEEIVSITKQYLYMSISSNILANRELSVVAVVVEDLAYRSDIPNLHEQVKITLILHRHNVTTVQAH